MILARGWTSDSVVAARKPLISRGFEVPRDRFAFTFVIGSQGGQWAVSLQ